MKHERNEFSTFIFIEPFLSNCKPLFRPLLSLDLHIPEQVTRLLDSPKRRDISYMQTLRDTEKLHLILLCYLINLE